MTIPVVCVAQPKELWQHTTKAPGRGMNLFTKQLYVIRTKVISKYNIVIRQVKQYSR
jgi:hypothetical protein